MSYDQDLADLNSQIQKEKNNLYNLVLGLTREDKTGLSHCGFRGANLNEAMGKMVKTYFKSTSDKIEKMTRSFERKYPL